jgi:hypothetical protein
VTVSDRGSKYPLEAVQVVREVAEDAAEARLVDAIRAHGEAVARRERAQAALSASRASAKARNAREAQIQAAACTAAELRRGERFREEQRRVEASLVDALVRARREEERASLEVATARRELGRAAADVEVAARHRRGWELARERKAERAREDELDDLAAARHRR